MKAGNPKGEYGVGLADELFGLVETLQGFAHISDGIHVLSDEQIVDLARSSLTNHRKLVRVLAKFVRRHEIKKLTPAASEPTDSTGITAARKD